jgi:hypothetical protein
MVPHLGGKVIPIQASWSKIHGSWESLASALTTTIRCQKEDYAEVCTTLKKLYGTDSVNKDLTEPIRDYIKERQVENAGIKPATS